MSERKRAGRTRTAATDPPASVSELDPTPESSEALGSPRRGLVGWSGLVIRFCVYLTAALCVELLLHAFEQWIAGADE